MIRILLTWFFCVPFLVPALLAVGPKPNSSAQSVVKLPLVFEPNQGQAQSQVRYILRAPKYTAFFTNFGIRFDMSGANDARAAVDLRWVDSRTADINGEDRQSSSSNYFIGSDPKQWHSDVPNFSRLRFHDLYPAVDAVYRSNGGKFEYDLVLRPNADLQQIMMKVDGATLTVRSDGALVMHTVAGNLVQRIPGVYQMRGDVRHRVRARFRLIAGNVVSFDVPHYDHTRKLMIDPVLAYSTLIGGSGSDTASKIVADKNGNAYVTGRTESADFPTTSGAYRRACVGTFGCSDAFIVKLTPSGNGVVYSTFIGGSGGDQGDGIAVDSSGNAYITGVTSSSDFPGGTMGTPPANSSAFVAKVNPTGSSLVYAERLGGSGPNEGVAIAVDSLAQAYVTGHTEASDFPVTSGAYQVTCGCAGSSGGDWDSFVTKFNAAGNAMVYSTYLGGSFSDFSHSIVVDGTGRAYVAGETGSHDFPTTAGAFQSTDPASDGVYKAFVTRLNASGTAAEYSTYLGGSSGGSGAGVDFDGLGNAYVVGSTSSANFPTTSGAIRHVPVRADAFISKLNSTGSALIYSTLFGGRRDDFGWAVEVNNNEAYVLGGTFSSDFPTTVTAFQRIFGGGQCGDTSSSPCPDAFVAKVNSTGTQLSYSTYLGGSGTEWIGGGTEEGGIALGPNGSIFVAGGTSSLNFPTSNTAYRRSFHDPEDGFAARIEPLCSLASASPSVTICSPGSAGVHSPVTVVAGTRDTLPVKLIQIYVDGTKKYEAALSAVQANIFMPAGNRRLTVRAVDTSGTVFKKTLFITVLP